MDETQDLLRRYNEFREHLRKGTVPPYTEDELIELFDIAGDNMDSYAQNEILGIAVRDFPKSDELLQRKGLLMRQLGVKALQDFLENNTDRDGVCWNLLRLNASDKEGTDALPVLRSILASADEMADEDIIRFCEAASEYQCQEWLLDNYKLLVDKAMYTDTALYETASIAHEANRDEFAVKLLEEVTSIDAFRAENWLLLAECYESLGNHEEGLKALEYARAINPDDPETDYLEGCLLLGAGRDYDRALRLLFNYLKVFPKSSPAIHNIVSIYQITGQNSMAIEFMKMKIAEDPSNPLMLQELCRVSISDATRYITENRGNGLMDFDMFLSENLQYAFFTGDFLSVIETFEQLMSAENAGDEAIRYYLWSLAYSNDYRKIYDFTVEHPLEDNSDYESCVLVALAALKTGYYNDATQRCSHFLAMKPASLRYGLDFRASVYGLSTICNQIMRLARLSDSDAIADFDPFLLRADITDMD